jgi:predicted Zn finger-like uncharacterized protein
MALNFSCDHCRKQYEVDESLAGRRVKCKACGTVLQVPGGSSAELRTPSRAPAGRPKKPPAPAGGYDEFEDRLGLQEMAQGGRRGESETLIPRGGARRAPSGGADGGVPVWVWLAAGGVGLVLIACLIGVLATRRSPAPAVAQAEAAAPSGTEPEAAETGPAASTSAAAPAEAPGVESTLFKRDDTVSAGSQMGWRIKLDPATAETTFNPPDKLTIPIPEAYSTHNELIYPKGPSPFVVVGGNDVEAQHREVWDLRTGTMVGKLGGKLEVARPIALSPDGAYFACHTNPVPRTTDIWRVADATRLGRIEDGKDIPDVIEFVGPSRIIIGSSYAKTLKVWDFLTGKLIATIETPEGFDKESFAPSPGMHYGALVIRSSAKLHVYDLTNGRLMGMAEVPKDGNMTLDPEALAFSPDGKALTGLFGAGFANHVVTWDATTGKLESDHRYEQHDPFGRSFAYDSQVVEWLPDQSGWLLYDQAIVERKSGQIAWTLPFDKRQGFVEGSRRIANLDRAVVVAKGKGGQKALRVTPLPRAKIETALALARGGGSAADAALPAVTAADRSAAKVVAPIAGPVAWTQVLDPLAPGKKLAGRIATRAKSQELLGLLVAGPAAQAFVTSGEGGRLMSDTKAKQGQEPRQVERIDLAAGRVLGQIEVPPTAMPIAVAPDASYVLLSHASGGDRLDVVSAADGAHVAGWRPYEKDGDENKEVVWADFLAPKQVLTINKAGTLILWSIPDCKAVYVAEGACQGIPALSPGRKVLAALRDGKLRLIDPATGEAKGDGGDASGQGKQGWKNAAFRPDGRELSAMVDSTIVRWDLTTGTVVDECPYVAMKTVWLQYAGNDHLLISGRSLVDLPHKRVVWILDGGVHAATSPDGSHWYAAGTFMKPASLTSIALPTKEVLRAETVSADPKTVAMLRAGATLDMQITGAPPHEADAFRQRLSDSMLAQLQSVGVTAADGGQVKLTATFREKDAGFTIQLRKFGGGAPEIRNMAARDIEAELTLDDDKGSKVVIARDEVTARTFGFVQLPPGENDWEGFIRTRQWFATADRLASHPLPYYVARKPEGAVILPGWSILGFPR